MRQRGHSALAALVACALLGAGLAGCDSDPAGPPQAERLADLITARTPRLVIEVDAVAGLALAEGVADDLRGLLAGVVDKPGGVDVVIDQSVARSGDAVWRWEEIEALSASHQSLAPEDGAAVVHVLLLDGRYAEGADGGVVLGLAGAHVIVAIFLDEIDRVAEASVAAVGSGKELLDRLRRQTQLAILVHEMGHIIGLVNVGVPATSAHEDPANPGHDVNPECVMRAVYNSSAAIAEIRGKLMHDDDLGIHFCAACQADLQAFRAQLATSPTE